MDEPLDHDERYVRAAEFIDVAKQLWDSWDDDGVNLKPSLLPDSLEDFVTLVVPELQRRGIFRTDYEYTTLRENLGLPRQRHPGPLPRPLQCVGPVPTTTAQAIPRGRRAFQP